MPLEILSDRGEMLPESLNLATLQVILCKLAKMRAVSGGRWCYTDGIELDVPDGATSQ